MADILILAIALLTLAALACLWRAWTMFTRWNPAVAHVRHSGYSEFDRQQDFWNRIGADFGGGAPLGVLPREIEDVVGYADETGECHVAAVRRSVSRGVAPDGVITVWYDPRRPQEPTASGPGAWLVGALGSLLLVAALFKLGLLLRG